MHNLIQWFQIVQWLVEIAKFIVDLSYAESQFLYSSGPM